MSREVFARDWRAKRQPKVDWVGRVLELLTVAGVVILICLEW
jgi:hypothetical protein